METLFEVMVDLVFVLDLHSQGRIGGVGEFEVVRVGSHCCARRSLERGQGDGAHSCARSVFLRCMVARADYDEIECDSNDLNFLSSIHVDKGGR